MFYPTMDPNATYEGYQQWIEEQNNKIQKLYEDEDYEIDGIVEEKILEELEGSNENENIKSK